MRLHCPFLLLEGQVSAQPATTHHTLSFLKEQTVPRGVTQGVYFEFAVVNVWSLLSSRIFRTLNEEEPRPVRRRSNLRT